MAGNTELTLQERAENRVDNSPILEPYRYILVEYVWDEGDEHLEWIATAELEEILDWCVVTKEGEPDG